MAANLNLDVIFGRDNMRGPVGCAQPTIVEDMKV
jgi:hypothetical protein